MKIGVNILTLLSVNTFSQTQQNQNKMENYLKETEILDYSSGNIQDLINEKQWLKLDTVERVKNIYNLQFLYLMC